MNLKTFYLVFLLRFLRLMAEEASEDLEDGLNPTACDYEKYVGYWIFEMGEGGFDKTINCLKPPANPATRHRMLFDRPDVVKDEFGNVGFWTMVDSLGFEVVIHGRKFFAYVKFKETVKGRDVLFCNETILGSSHNVLGDDWTCLYGRKVSSGSTPRSNDQQQSIREILEREGGREKRSTGGLSRRELQKITYRTELDMVDAINAAQSSWTATHYEEYDSMTMDEFLSRAGSRLQRKTRVKGQAKMTKEQEDRIAALPTSFDWRNVKGLNYVSPVRDQGKCGSCYAFTTAAMNEARLAIFTNNTARVIFSTQDVVDCTFYSLGCDGGSSYAISKYSEDYGMVVESCNPYKGVESNTCPTKSSCKRYYFTGYEYIGGYYGGCNVADMMVALVTNGPLAIAIKVNEDMMFYKSGIYRSTGIKSKMNPYVEVDHAVTLVGYGEDKTHGKYWIIKNSWGTKWGNNGYFNLARGTNECGVESMAVQSFPIF